MKKIAHHVPVFLFSSHIDIEDRSYTKEYIRDFLTEELKKHANPCSRQEEIDRGEII